LNSRQGTRAATEFILRATLLEQFNHVREERARVESERVESRRERRTEEKGRKRW
jgi:hypothetical protein